MVLFQIIFASQVWAEGLLNLRKPDKPRFPITEIVWASQPGDVSICLWADDKLAAFSYGIDDNEAMDVPWWLEITKKYNIRITWHLITGGITEKPHNLNGDWGLWKKVLAEGHAIESHSVTHLSMVGKAGWQGTEWEYSESKKQIEEHMPGWSVYCLCYPGGKGQETNDPDLAAKYYLAGRTTYPLPNPANELDYLKVNGNSGGYFRPLEEDPKQDWGNMNNVLNQACKAYYRGWLVNFWHYVGGNEDAKKRITDLFDWAHKHSDQLWFGLFRDVARYGQERDTANLVVNENTGAKIAFTLTDQMDDRYYDYPLTIKVRLPGNWKGVKAVQKKNELAVKIVEKGGGNFALVNVVPDRGQVALTNSGATIK